jgi:SAM-dependent methyltransferase
MLGQWPRDGSTGAVPVRAVAQRPPFRSGSIDLVLFPYNGFHCILDRVERLAVLEEAAGLLRPGGVLVVETCPQFHERQDEDDKVRYTFSRDGASLRLLESVSHDRTGGRIFFDMVYTGSVVSGGRTELRLELALITAGELLEDIRCSGMCIYCVWGDYDLSPWDCETSPRLLVMAGRNSR